MVAVVGDSGLSLCPVLGCLFLFRVGVGFRWVPVVGMLVCVCGFPRWSV